VVGPDTRCQLDPHRAPTIAGIIAAYRPYSGGRPAIVANATACGRTTIAPVRAATESALNVCEVTLGHQRRKGNRR
jgi:hypothetical protein